MGQINPNEKCCAGISVIDCQPPDYYSAVLNSVPIQQYLLYNYDDDEINNNNHEHDNDDIDGHLATLQLNFDACSMSSGDNESGGSYTTKRSYLLPPTYDEVTPHK